MPARYIGLPCNLQTNIYSWILLWLGETHSSFYPCTHQSETSLQDVYSSFQRIKFSYLQAQILKPSIANLFSSFWRKEAKMGKKTISFSVLCLIFTFTSVFPVINVLQIPNWRQPLSHPEDIRDSFPHPPSFHRKCLVKMRSGSES